MGRASGLRFLSHPDDFTPPELPDSGHFTFPSPYPGEHEINNQAGFDFFPCKEGWSAPTMLLAHGLMSVSDFGYKLWAKRLNARGWNAVFVHLPYHYSRRLRVISTASFASVAIFSARRPASGNRSSNAGSFSSNCAKKAANFSAVGARATVAGSWHWWPASRPLLQRLVLVEPILNIDNAIWKAPSSVSLRAGLRRFGITPQDTAGSMRLVCPGKLDALLPGKHIVAIAGEFDRIAPPNEIEELARKWGASYACFPQGHVGYTLMPESFRMAQELWAADFARGPSFTAPSSELKSEAIDAV